MFDEKYRKFGYVKVINGRVRVYCGPNNFQDLIETDAVSAQWAGDGIITINRNGQQRRWTSFNCYDVINV